MRVRRGCSLLTVIVACLAAWSCAGNPPDKEMQQARGAIDAARAAGAEQYAREEIDAAEDDLRQARAAVDDRDYRLALNHALDARARAQNAAKETADHKAAARVDAEGALRDATAALATASMRLRAAEAARAPASKLDELRRAIADSEKNVQEARATMQRGEYLAVLDGLTASTLRLRDATLSLEAESGPASRRRR